MNGLPRVLQDEIWEHVRGDRAYWRQRHQELVTDRMNVLIEIMEANGGMILPRHEILVYRANTPISPGSWPFVPQFMKYQHRTHGQLFADTYEEYGRKLEQRRSFFATLGYLVH
jgi:hypothetical protein